MLTSDQTWDLSAYLRIRQVRDSLLRPVAAGIASTGVPPTAVSLLGVLLAASLFWSLDRTAPLALAAFLGALACDAVDGAVARRQGSSSSAGKRIDHACDVATFLLVLTAIFRCHLAGGPQLLLAALLSVPLLLLAIHCRRVRGGREGCEPVGGLLAHLFKVPVYAMFLLYLAGGPNLLDPGLRVANVVAMASAALLVFGRLSATGRVKPVHPAPESGAPNAG